MFLCQWTLSLHVPWILSILLDVIQLWSGSTHFKANWFPSKLTDSLQNRLHVYSSCESGYVHTVYENTATGITNLTMRMWIGATNHLSLVLKYLHPNMVLVRAQVFQLVYPLVHQLVWTGRKQRMWKRDEGKGQRGIDTTLYVRTLHYLTVHVQYMCMYLTDSDLLTRTVHE